MSLYDPEFPKLADNFSVVIWGQEEMANNITASSSSK